MANHRETVGTKLDHASVVALTQIAKREDLTVSQVLRRAIREYLNRQAKGERDGK